MNYIYINSGTSNTRVYLIQDGEIIDNLKKQIGSKDSSIAEDNSVLIKELKLLYDQLLSQNKLKENDIDEIFASGMVTSPFGFKDIPHLSVPVGRKKLKQNIYNFYEENFFQRRIQLIRGVKTIQDSFVFDKHNIYQLNHVRGEEIEVFGILSMLINSWKDQDLAIFLPGSHTHIINTKQGKIVDIISTFSGEIFHAISQNTILSSSIDSNLKSYDIEMILMGFKYLKIYGINRALYLMNTMQVFTDMSKREKTSYIEGVIMGGVIIYFIKVLENKWSKVKRVILAGDHKITEIYRILLEDTKLNLLVKTIPQSKTDFAVKGILTMLKI